MAKKKGEPAPVETPGKNQYVAAALAEIEKNYGAGIVRSGRQIVDNPPAVIPVAPALDSILGGGIPEGSWVSLSGMEKSGKSITALTFAANCQKPEYGSRPVMVLAAEHRSDPLLLNGIRGLDLEPPNLNIVESTEGRVLSSVDFLNIGLTFIRTVPGGVLIVDSISSLVNPKIIADGLGTSDYGGGNRIVTQFIDLAVPAVKANRCVVLGVVQRYANTSGYGKDFKEKAATKWWFQSDIRLEVQKFSFAYGNGKDEPPTGQEVDWLCRKAALTGPGAKTTSHIRFGVGVDRVKELMLQGADFGLIEKSGNWFYLNYLDGKADLLGGETAVPKGNGEEQAYQLLESNPAWVAELERQTQELLTPEPATCA